MLAAAFKRTKIVATIGPVSNSPKVLEELLLAGVNMFRLNFSHGTHAQHGAVIKIARELSERHHKPVALLADMQGPMIRVGMLPEDGLDLKPGHDVAFKYGADYDRDKVIPVQHDVSKYLKVGERIFLRDGIIQVEVTELEGQLIKGRVLSAGLLRSNQGMNLPDTDLGGDILTDKDLADIDFAVKSNVDYIAFSFCQTAKDVYNLKDRLKELGADQLVIAKIETKAALENLEEIVAATDAIMVARGDLAVETQPEVVPMAQRRMVELCRAASKPVIVATQMLESMIGSPQPTRAEVSDVATAVMQGADAVMLSGETAMGLYPVDTVRLMKRVILYTEREELRRHSAEAFTMDGTEASGNAVSAAAVVLARRLPAKVIIAETATGQTARNIAAQRPTVPIVMVTDRFRTYQQLAIVWGGKSYLHSDPASASQHVAGELKAAGNVETGDALVVASGNAPGVPGGTDKVWIRVVE